MSLNHLNHQNISITHHNMSCIMDNYCSSNSTETSLLNKPPKKSVKKQNKKASSSSSSFSQELEMIKEAKREEQRLKTEERLAREKKEKSERYFDNKRKLEEHPELIQKIIELNGKLELSYSYGNDRIAEKEAKYAELVTLYERCQEQVSRLQEEIKALEEKANNTVITHNIDDGLREAITNTIVKELRSAQAQAQTQVQARVFSFKSFIIRYIVIALLIGFIMMAVDE